MAATLITIEVVRETEKAAFVRHEGQDFWVKKAWLREGNCLSETTIKNALQRKEEEAAYRAEQAECNATWKASFSAFDVVKETEKAVMGKVYVDAIHSERDLERTFWVPKSLLDGEGRAPNWFLKKKFDEILEDLKDFCPREAYDLTFNYDIQN